MKSTFHKCVVNLLPVTDPTPMSESDKYNAKAIKTKIYPKIAFIRNRELAELALYLPRADYSWGNKRSTVGTIAEGRLGRPLTLGMLETTSKQ